MSQQVSRKRGLKSLLLIVLLTMDVSCTSAKSQEQHPWNEEKAKALQQFASNHNALAVCERKAGIYLFQIGKLEPRLLVDQGSWPRFSSDGKWVAFVRSNAIMRVGVEGGLPEELAVAQKPRAVAVGDDSKQVFFTDRESIKAVNTSSHSLQLIKDGRRFKEIGITGNKLVTSVRGLTGVYLRAYDLDTGSDRNFAPGCSASISADGKLVTGNTSSHRYLNLYSWESGNVEQVIPAPAGRTFDNQKWSNDPRYLVSVTDDAQRDVFVHDVVSKEAVQITNVGDCDRPDLFVSTK